MAFGMTPATYPQATADAFPTGVQWQFRGANVGGTAITTVNVVPGPEAAMSVSEDNVLTITVYDPNPSLW